MIDSTKLAQLIHNEARQYAEKTHLANDPDMTRTVGRRRVVLVGTPGLDPATATTEEIASYLFRTSPLPAVDDLARVIEEVFWASMLAEEGRPCRPRVLYLPMFREDRPVHWLSTPVPLTRKSLRKLTPAHGSLGYITWRLENGCPIITGFEARQGGDPEDLIINATAAGALDLMWQSCRLVVLRAGEVYHVSEFDLPHVFDAMDDVSKLFGSHAVIFLARTVEAIANGGHGGALWIAREGWSPTVVDCRRIFFDHRPLLERFPRVEQRRPWLSSIAHLAAVDGAVVVDTQGRVLSFASFIRDLQPVNVTRTLSGGKEETVPWNNLGGGRHRSAAAFCQRFAPAAAIVVSEDGPISVFTASNEEQVRVLETSALGFSF